MDEQRRRNSPVKVHFGERYGWGDERGIVGPGSDHAKKQAEELQRFND